MSKSEAKKTAKVTQKTKVIFDRQKQKAKTKKVPEWQSSRATKRIRPWVEDKIKAARKLSEHRAARTAARFGGPAGVALMILLALTSLLWPKDEFQKAKEQLAKNPNNLEAHLTLAEEFLKNNQFEEAEKVLLLTQQIKFQGDKVSGRQSENVLGEKTESELNKLWERKTYSDPEEIKRLITAWEKILQEKPDYRDGYLQLAVLYYKIYGDEKAKENLQKALELDPNFEAAREWERVIQ